MLVIGHRQAVKPLRPIFVEMALYFDFRKLWAGSNLFFDLAQDRVFG